MVQDTVDGDALDQRSNSGFSTKNSALRGQIQPILNFCRVIIFSVLAFQYLDKLLE